MIHASVDLPSAYHVVSLAKHSWSFARVYKKCLSTRICAAFLL